MKYLLILSLMLGYCNNDKLAEEQMKQADLAMSDLATKIGFHQALLAYAEDSVIIPRQGHMPMMSKVEVKQNWEDKPLLKELTWYPVKATVAKSGDMGFTFGFATFKGDDTTTYTNYCTIWHKQPDGKWKFVYDGGNSIPNPFK